MTTPGQQSSEPSGAALWLRAVLVTAPVFVPLIGLLVLDLTGAWPIDRRLAFHGDLIGSLIFYWLVAAALLAAVRHRKRLKGWLRRRRAPLLATGFSLALAFAAAEVGLRMIRHPEAMPQFKWVKNKRLHHANPASLDSLREGVRVVTNEDGLRSLYGRGDFEVHRDRIVVMGDSFAFGLGVRQGKTVSRELERELRERSKRDDLAVLNAGVVSYSPLLERTQFREVVRHYRPTLTLLLLDGNDIGDDYKYTDMNLSDDPQQTLFDVPDEQRGVHSAVLTITRRLWSALATPYKVLERFYPSLRTQDDYYKFDLDIGGVHETDHWFILRHPLELTRSYFDLSFGYVREIAAEAEAIGSEFVLVVTPRFFHWSDRECPRNWESMRYRLDEPHEYAYFEYFDAVAESAGFRVLSLLPAFQATDEFPLVFPNDPHWNAAGHRFVARTLADYLVGEGLVQP